MPEDFSGENLRGRSFKGQDLSGANFSGADIRGANFSNAILKDANFSGVLGGLPRKWLITLILLSHSLTILSTLSSISIISLFRAWISNIFFESNLILITLCMTIFFALILIAAKQYFLKKLILITAIVVILCGIILTISQNILVLFKSDIVFLATAVAGCLTISTTLIIIIAFSIVLIKILSKKSYYLVVIISALIAGFLGTIFRSVLRIESTVEFTNLILNPGFKWARIDIFWGTIWSWTVTCIGYYIGLLSFKENDELTLIKKIAIVLSSVGSTNYYQADLQNANFEKATLKNTDFRFANLKGTWWLQVKQLHMARVGNSYLQYPVVRQLLTSGWGQNKNFDYLHLQGINLKGAFLTNASFIGADLSEANLQDADLSRAILKQTQLDGTDFTGATLTGAIIEDWNITSDTKFDGVRCEYVYMRLPTKENPEPWRKPDNRQEVFADGEFGDFIKPIIDTLDLYHSQGVDPRAIAIAYKELAENNPDAELEIVAMEKRGKDKFLLRAKTAPEVDKSELSAEYFETYNYLKSLPPSEQIKHFLTELKVKDNQISLQQNHISRLENMISTALERPSLQAQNIYSQGGIISQCQQQQKETQTETNNSTVKTILILASNPKNTSQLRLDEEVREIDAGLQRAKKRELFDLKQRWAVRVQDVYQAMLDLKPQIVHFSGHGTGDDGLALEDEFGKLKLVDTEALAKLFELFSTTIECVVLNACYSEVQAEAIVKHIPYVIGMNQAIGDKASVKFATGFYNAIGAGESVEFAYKLGCNVIQLDGIPEHLTPVLKKK